MGKRERDGGTLRKHSKRYHSKRIEIANRIAMGDPVPSVESVLGVSAELRGELRENLRKLRLMNFKCRYWDYGPFMD